MCTVQATKNYGLECEVVIVEITRICASMALESTWQTFREFDLFGPLRDYTCNGGYLRTNSNLKQLHPCMLWLQFH